MTLSRITYVLFGFCGASAFIQLLLGNATAAAGFAIATALLVMFRRKDLL